jgi:acyl dehydratase
VTAWELGAELPELRVVPDPGVTARYAAASGDSNPIHLDDEFARSVGLPGRILHGLYTMALLARAQTQAAGGPGHLKRLAAQFRGTALPGEELTVSSSVSARAGTRVTTTATVTQRGRAVIRGASAELDV